MCWSVCYDRHGRNDSFRCPSGVACVNRFLNAVRAASDNDTGSTGKPRMKRWKELEMCKLVAPYQGEFGGCVVLEKPDPAASTCRRTQCSDMPPRITMSR